MGEGLHGMSVAMDCASGAGAEWSRRIEREAEGTLLADAINFPFPEVCRGLGIGDLGDDFRAPFESDIPALLISGSLDGRTPVANGVEVLRGLPNGHHLVLEGAGHSDPLFLSSPRILDAMKSFLRGEAIAFDRIELPPMRFVKPRTVVQLGDETLTKYVGTYRIAEADERRVMKAGDLLFTQRGRGQALPIRPVSETDFFYEGSATRLTFELDDEGAVTGMRVFHDGAEEAEPARKVE